MKETTSGKKSVKTLKGQLFGAVSMLLVATIALGTSTYAWFVNNRTVEVQNMELTVSAASALQIAVKQNGDTGVNANGVAANHTPFKNLLAMEDITGLTAADGTGGAGWTTMFKKADGKANPMQPASVTSASLNTVSPAFFRSTGAMGAQNLTVFEPAAVGMDDVKVLPLVFQSSNDVNVYFGAAEDASDPAHTVPALTAITELVSQRVAGDTLSADQADGIRKALRVGLVCPSTYDGDGNVTATQVKIFQFADDTHLTTAGYNTDYTRLMTVDGTTAGSNADAIAAAKLLQDEANGKYPAVAAIESGLTDPDDIYNGYVKSVGTQAALTTAAAVKSIATVASPTDVTTTNPNDYLFQLKANKPADVTVYIWLEGTDQDCVSELSQYLFDLRLPFASVDTPVGP